MAYDAFISYSHEADGRLAPAVQSGLQRLARPWYRMRALRVFRDETGLAVNPHLWASIEAALDESEYFVLLASPESAASPWVAREIEHWTLTRPVDRILPVLTDGDLVWDSAIGGYDVARSTALPALLATAFVAEPRHLDLRWARTEEQVDLHHAGFRAAIAGLAAPMHGVSRDELEGEDVQQHRRTMRFAWGAAALLLFVTIAAVVAATFAVSYASEARANERRAVAEGARARHNAHEATSQRLLAVQNASAATSAQSQAEANAAEADQNATEAGQNANEATQQRLRAQENAAASARNAAEAKANGQEAQQQSVAAQQNAAEASANALRANANAQQAEASAAAAAQSAKDARSAADVAAAQRERAVRSADRARAERAEAERSATLARSRQLAARALNIVDTDPDQALLTAVQGRRFQVNAQTDDGLMRTVQRQPVGVLGYVRPPAAMGDPDRIVASPDGRVLAAISRGGALVLRDLADGRALPAPALTVDLTGRIGGVVFSADGRRMAVVSDAGQIVAWDVFAGRRLAALPAAVDAPPVIALSPDGGTLVSYDPVRGIVVDDLRSGTPSFVPTSAVPAGFSPSAIAVDNAGRMVALHAVAFPAADAPEAAGRVVVFDVGSGTTRADLTAEMGLTPTLNDRHTVALRFDGTGESERLTSVEANATDDTLISWSTTTWARVREMPTPALETGEIVAATDADLTHVASTADDGRVRVRDVATGAVVASLDARITDCELGCSGTLGVPNVIAFGPDRTVVALGADRLIRRFAAASTATGARLVRRLPIPMVTGSAVALSADGTRVAMVNQGGVVDVWAASGGTIRTLAAPAAQQHQVMLSRDGATVAVGSAVPGPDPFSTRLIVDAWDVATGTHRFHVETGLGTAGVMAFDPSGRLLAVPGTAPVFGEDSKVLVLDVATGQTLVTIPTGLIFGQPSFSADGRSLVVGNLIDGPPLVADVASGRVRTLEDPRLAGAIAVHFSADGRVAVSRPVGRGDLVILDAETLSVRRTISLPDTVQDVAVSPDGRRAAVTFFSGGIQLYDTGTGETVGDRVATPRLSGGTFVSFTADGRSVIGAGTVGFLRVDLDPASWAAQACAIAGRNLTRAEWTGLLGSGVPYVATCPGYGSG